MDEEIKELYMIEADIVGFGRRVYLNEAWVDFVNNPSRLFDALSKDKDFDPYCVFTANPAKAAKFDADAIKDYSELRGLKEPFKSEFFYAIFAEKTGDVDQDIEDYLTVVPADEALSGDQKKVAIEDVDPFDAF